MKVAKRPLLERVAVGYFRRRQEKLPRPAADDAIHFLNAEERAALRRIHNLCIVRAALAGALAAGLIAAVEVFLLRGMPDQTTHYVLLGITTCLVAAVEIGYLYFDALRSVHDLAHAAGLDLFGADEEEAVAAALARAALELPNPPERVFGVDPRREISKTRLLLATIAYKAKVGISNFLVEALIRRALGRAALRGFLPFVGVPITAMWNVAVAWKVLREARIRVMGPSASDEMCERILAVAGDISPLGRDTLVRAVGSAIVRTHDMHPNLRYMLVSLTKRLGEDEDADVDDPSVFLQQLAKLPADEQTAALRVLNVASVIDGRLTVAETGLIRAAQKICGHPQDPEAVQRLRKAFVRGEDIPDALILT